jgi:E3 ubiquitin-protein ligase MYCBP2
VWINQSSQLWYFKKMLTLSCEVIFSLLFFQSQAKNVTQMGTQTSPEANKTNQFNLGAELISDLTRSPQRLSPKASRTKERASRGGTRSRKSRSPTAGQHIGGRSLMLEQEIARVGMSPSTAECLRAVFAANLWHQGLVHDAMACASFLKFHPNLPKQVDPIVPLRGDPRHRKTREEKARQRHSVEIFSTNMLSGPFASPLPVALEESWNTERGESASNHQIQPDVPDNKVASSLTPTLSLLVELWEKMSGRCIELIQSEPTASSSTLSVAQFQNESVSKAKPKTENRDARDKERKRKSRRESIRPESNCELCGGLFAVPVTAHMRQAHPGCQKPALGLGYNPDGQYCGGWVGNCGEGGIQVRSKLDSSVDMQINSSLFLC